MSPEQLGALRPGDLIEVQLKLDHSVEGRIISTSGNGVYVEWVDGQPTFEPRSKLLRWNWSFLGPSGAEE